MSPSHEAAREILESRARRLARAPKVESRDESRPLLVFGQGQERFALDAGLVHAVFRLRHISPLPGAPASIAGLTSWRGHILTVVDLEQLLEIRRSGLDDRVWVVVVDADSTTFGVLAGAVDGVIALRPDGLSDPDTSAKGLITGVTADAVAVLDGRALTARLISLRGAS